MRKLQIHSLAALFITCTLPGCVVTEFQPARRGDNLTQAEIRAARVKLRRVGLELIDPSRAGVPPSEQARVLAVRSIPGAESPALTPLRGGYLLVGIDRHYVDDATQILAALRDWIPGESLVVTARRNPYGPEGLDFWESEVRLVLPK